MGSILSENMSFSDQMWLFFQIYQQWLMTDQSQIQLFRVFQSWREYMSYPIIFNCAEKRFFGCGLWEDYLLTSNWVNLNLDSSSWLWISCSLSQLLALLAIWYRLWVSWIAHVKIHQQILGLLLRQRRDEYKIHLVASSFFVNKCVWLGIS